MPELLTKAFGMIDILPEQVLRFPDGIFGFSDEKEFALLEESEESPFKWLQSTRIPSLAFIVIQPELFMKHPYIPDVTEMELNRMEVENISDCLIFVIVTIPESNPELMTANLQGPILINRKKKLARQCISLNEKHSVRVTMLEQMDG
jgi:flagellar assembly factor FliW